MSSSFWSQIRWRLGGHSGVANQIHDLVQKQIDANADVQDVTIEEILAPIITLPSKMTMTDKLFRASVRDITVGQNAIYPVDPDLSTLRFWVKNYNGGAYLDDWSCMNNTVQLNGTNQPELVWSSDDDGIGGMLPVNRLIDDQYIRVVDNPNVRIKEISATATGISIFLRIYIQFNQNDQIFGRPGVLFSKIDTEQVDYAYAAYLHDNGSIEFFVRNASREFSLTAPANTLVWEAIHLPDFNAENFTGIDYNTSLPGGGIIPPLIDPVPYTDLCFTFQFSSNRMQIIKNGSVLTDSNTNPEGSGLVGAWKLNEGGDIGNTPDGPSSYARTVFNSVTTGNNGTITNATWSNSLNASETLLSFDGTGDRVNITNYAAIQQPTAFTVSFWFYYGGQPPNDFAKLVTKGLTGTANTWWIYLEEPDHHLRFTTWDSTNTRTDAEHPNQLVSGNWYHVVARVAIGSTKIVYLNNIKFVGNNTAGSTLNTGTTDLLIGDSGANSARGRIYDLKMWNRQLSDSEVTTVYNAGHAVSGFPAWKPNPPLVPGAPGPVVNPFVSVYNVPTPLVAEQDVTRLHKLTVTSLTERYNVSQGTTQNPSTIGEDVQYYDNDPTYDSGTAVQEVVSTYAQQATQPISAQYMTLNNATFAGQRFLTGSDVVGKPILKVIANMADTNTNVTPATGNIVAKIIRNTDGVVQFTSNTIDSQTLTNNQGGSSASAWTPCTFSFAGNTYVTANNDKIQFEFDQGGVSPEFITAYSQLSATLTAGAHAALNSTVIGGQKFVTGIDVIGKPITRIVTKMADINSSNIAATGTVVAKIYSGTTLKATSNTIDASTFSDNPSINTTSWTTVTFTFSGNTYNMITGDRVQFEFDQGGALLDVEVASDYNQLATTPTAGQYSALNTTYIGGQKFLTGSGVIGKPITKIIAKMADVNPSGAAASGNIVAKIYSGSTLQFTSNTVSAAGLQDNQGGTSTSAWTNASFLFSGNTYNTLNGDRVQFEFDQGGALITTETLTAYNQLATASVSGTASTLSAQNAYGQVFLTGSDVVGKAITKVVVKLCDLNPTNNPATGNVVAKIITAGHVLKSTSNTVAATGLADNAGASSTSAWTTSTFTFSANAWVMANGDRVQLEYDEGGTVGGTGETLSGYDHLNDPVADGGAAFGTMDHDSTPLENLNNTSSVLHGKIVTKIVAKLTDNAQSTGVQASGTVIARIRRGDNNTVVASSNTIAASALADYPSSSNHTFTFSGNTWVMSGSRTDFINIETSNYGGGSNGTLVGWAFCNDVEPNMQAYGNGGGISYPQYDCCMDVYVESAGSYKQVGVSTVNTSVEANSNVYSTPFTTTLTQSSSVDWLMDVYYGSTAIAKSVGIALLSSTAEANSNTVQAQWSAPNTFSDISGDLAMDVYQPGKVVGMSVGIPLLGDVAEANSNTVTAQWTAPTTFSDVAGDLAMDVYQGSITNAKAVGIPYFSTNPEANSNTYDAQWSAPTTISERTTFDIGADVYINAATGTPNHLYTQLQNAGNKFAASFLASTSAGLFTQKASRVTARLNKVGAPTGTLFCRIKKASDSSTITFGLNNVANAGLDVSTLTTGATPATLYSFENDAAGQPDGGYAIQSGDRIMFELVGGTSSGSAYVQIARTHTTSRIPNVHMQTSPDGTTWTPSSPGTDDIIGQVIVGGVTTPTVDPYYMLGYGNERVLQKVTQTTAVLGNIHNQKITQVRVWLKRVGTPTGFITCGIRNAAGSLVKTINTFDAASVSDVSFTQYTFTDITNAYTMAINDRISLEFSGGNASNHIQINANLLDTYPYGNLELFDGSAYSDRPVHDLAAFMYSGGGATDPLARTRVAEYVATASSAIKLKQISRIQVMLKRTGGTLPGNLSFFIRNAANTVVATIGTISAITIDPNTLTSYTVTSSPISVYALQVGDYISIEYNDGDDFNYIDVMTTKTTDAFDGTTNTYLVKYDDVNWVSNNAIDLVAQMWEGGDTYTPSQEDVTIPPPLYTKDLTILAGGSPWTYINHSRPSLTPPQSQFYINAVLSDCRFYRRILTVGELGNLLTNRTDVGAITFGSVAVTGFFALSET